MNIKNSIINLNLILIFLFLTSCSIGPDYVRPKIQTPTKWQSSSKSLRPQKLKAIANYWRIFNDSNLNQLIKVSNIENLTLQESFFRIQETTAALGIRFSDFFPQINATGNIATRRRSESVASAITGAENDFIGLGAELNWELDILGRLRRLQESAKATMEASFEDYFDTRVVLYSQVASNYILYRTTENRIELANENIKNQKESLELARDLFTAGVAPELDVKQAESNLGATEAILPTLRIQLAQAKNQLSVLIGILPEDLELILKKNQPIPTFKKFNQDKIPLNILRQRPDIRRAERELAAQHALIGVAKAEHYPIVTLPGQISFEALNTLEDAFKTRSLAYSIGPNITWNIFNMRRVSRNIELQEARTKQFLQRYRQSVLNAIQDVENAIVRLREEKIREQSLKKSVKASKESVILVKSLYAAGLTDFQNVLDSERRLFEQQLNLAETRGAVAQSAVALYRSLGGGWKTSKIPKKLKKS